MSGEPTAHSVHTSRSETFNTAAIFALVVMATWTLVIKFLAPVLFFQAERWAGRPIDGIPFMWDFWWGPHIWLAWLLWHRHRWAWPAGVVISVAEIIIVVTKFAFYLAAPDLSFWKLLWFTNKVYVLGFFIGYLILLWTPGYRTWLKRKGAP